LPLNKRLFALWEGGSAYEINPKTLATIGIQSWSPQTKGLPFGAHYRQAHHRQTNDDNAYHRLHFVQVRYDKKSHSNLVEFSP
jgi:carotenoid cleavage dioxygenase-like enzyme